MQEYPVTLMQFLLFLYHNQSDFVPLCMGGEFLCGLAATLFPYRIASESESEFSSPVDEFKVCVPTSRTISSTYEIQPFPSMMGTRPPALPLPKPSWTRLLEEWNGLFNINVNLSSNGNICIFSQSNRVTLMCISSVVLIVINSLRFQPFPESDSMVLVDTAERSSTKSKYFYFFREKRLKRFNKMQTGEEKFFSGLLL